MRINEFLVKDKMSYGSNYQPKLEILIMMKKKIDYVGFNGLQLVKYVRLHSSTGAMIGTARSTF